ncbi:MAG: 1,4-alpha-glucan branching protein GlgB [Miniphocaeibacter sp.]|uniref:1,4-alpha-glucan branching protein GlgB n=1 Tax=Miniphocaeibacter sp. TaxID=3100973 RepID=UPI003BAF908A
MKKPIINYYYTEEGEEDAYLFNKGINEKSYEFLGAHKYIEGDKETVRFVVWAPNAKYVNLVGDFNDWDDYNLPMKMIGETGLWIINVFDVKEYDSYKYRIVTKNDEIKYKADPYAFHAELKPKTASKYYDLKGYKWKDKRWLNKKKKADIYKTPMSIYEVNLASWKKKDNGDYYSYVELADELVNYVKEMGYTHVEIMPITEYPFDGSWGYQTTGYFAPTSRFGTPKDFMYLVDKFHQKNIGVILDWVPVHFCKDDFGLAKFDGTGLYESSNSYEAENEQWGTLNFDFKKNEVRNFLISSALYWHDYYHIDGIRVDAVAYMLYLDFTGKDIKNEDGGNENKEAVSFIRELNTVIFKNYPNTLMIAEESTAWPNITMPVELDGLGFNYKWNMGWMNDTLRYIKLDPLFRKDHHDLLTFSLVYAFSENYILPFSHDEVVHMKGSMINKMPGEYSQKFDSLRLLMMYMYGHPGKKLNFMGNEIAQFDEWNEWDEITWSVLDYEKHVKYKKFISDLNNFYRKEKALWEEDFDYEGFNWLEVNNNKESVVIFERISDKGEKLICAYNFTPVLRKNYPIGVDEEGTYSVMLNSDMQKYGGNLLRNKPYKTKEEEIHSKKYSIRVDLPPLGAMFIKLKQK